MDFIFRLLATMAGLWASTILPGISFTGGSFLNRFLMLAVVALVFTIVNSLVRPLVNVLTFPLYMLTFGLFALVTNALMFMLTGWVASSFNIPFEVNGFWPALFGAIIVAVIASIVSGILGVSSKDKE
ncbi:phage holin family protein [Schaalia sp. ZJ405]|uniref:phage holin family protein n=1 Tax=unclassified Schaalia TaxID=2691889 RepID=UPI0013EC7CEB|nr:MULTISPECIES: phage holin family protein [unclassified Schaalia]QPK81399.1 phage holin family protein [Schaalia sp. ZJ405]